MAAAADIQYNELMRDPVLRTARRLRLLVNQSIT
jgi:hypothetical protein